ncbi:transketolase [Furfurilactobacillus siliginis]|uniref:Transketolase n=1 Tax=Furfurilactobacillus siliginis TaxID=348151 RepID=A0A0R2L1S0_9LACO|nr:transketolase [Furfurilactobacillus siliginis]KRN95769.1 transketolase [Furfurilactobacillus siliginis]GEK28955.1 transketolase [Furfurilactobacillus siliginis]
MSNQSTDQQNINALRVLSATTITNAGAGHPGIALGAAPMLYTIWSRHLRIDPQHPKWINRDRFVLSPGHGSALLYSLLHLSGFDITMQDLKAFRQLGSRTPGHPEVLPDNGIDATTGPLGQGFAMGVGMATAQVHLSGLLDEDANLMDHDTFVVVGDGDLMEGISHEAASFASLHELNRLIVLYDSNDASLDSQTKAEFKTDVRQRFESYGWHTALVSDGESVDDIDAAIVAAKAQQDAPTLIEVKTTIGFGTKHAGSHLSHGKPLTDSELDELKRLLSWPAADFEIPAAVTDSFHELVAKRGMMTYQAWHKRLTMFLQEAAHRKLWQGLFSPTIDVDMLPTFETGTKAAGRNVGGQVIQAMSAQLPGFWGGAADVASSTKTNIEDGGVFGQAQPAGKNITFGIREFAQAAIINGITLHGGTQVFGSLFFAFADYSKAAIRLAAMQHIPSIFVLTHDSIGLGSDGPTHQPVEQLMGFRNMPNVNVLRPGTPSEVVAAWQVALASTDRPTLLILARQNLTESTHHASLQDVTNGAYTVSEASTTVSAVLMATGSEVQLALAAKSQLGIDGSGVRVLSMPNLHAFDERSLAQRERLLPRVVTNRVAVEMGSTLGWERYTGLDGHVIGIDEFGASGAGDAVAAHFGFTTEHIIECLTTSAEVRNDA